MTHVGVWEDLEIRWKLSTHDVVYNGYLKNNWVVIYKENIPRTIENGGKGKLLLCIKTFSWVTNPIQLEVGNNPLRWDPYFKVHERIITSTICTSDDSSTPNGKLSRLEFHQ